MLFHITEICGRVKKFKNQMQISKIESNCFGSVSTLSKYYSLLNEEHGTTFMLSRTGNKRQFMSPALLEENRGYANCFSAGTNNL